MIRRDKNSVEFIYCECGCGLTRPKHDPQGRQRTIIKGHHNKGKNFSGENNPSWKGGKYIDGYGYVWIHSPNHPNKNSIGYVKEHRLVIEKYIGRYLRKDELIHHINLNPQDNRIENLQIITHSEHMKIHNSKDMSNRKCLICKSKTTYKTKNNTQRWLRHPYTKEEWLCMKCYNFLIKNTVYLAPCSRFATHCPYCY